nr:LPXTG cell wall anchor domain-containing protein [uncultured Acetatifactor sp.]
MKGKMRKLFAFALAAIMVLAMGITASAQTVPAGAEKRPDTATITIKNTAKGETYEIYKIFDATRSENGSIAFKLMDGKTAEGLPAGFTVNATSKYVTAAPESLSPADIVALEEYVGKGTVTPVASATSSDGSTLEFINLEYGYYLVASSTGAVVSIDDTNPDAMIVDKNPTGPEVPEDAKKVKDDDVYIGQQVEYTLKFNTTNYVVPENATQETEPKQIVSYIITDTLPDFLSDVNVTAINVIVGSGDSATTTPLDVQQFARTDGAGPGTITIPWRNEETKASLYDNGAVLEITYTATVNENISLTSTENANTVTLSWKYDDDSEGGGSDKYTNTETISTYAMIIQKVDGNGLNLAGATFVINGYEVTPVKEGENEVVGQYKITGTKEGESSVMSCDEDGKLVIIGLAQNGDGTDVPQKYSITEKSAPDGYNLLVGETEVTAQKTSTVTTTTETTIWFDANGNKVDTEENSVTSVTGNTVPDDSVSIKIENVAGTLLPSTGGIGTTIFYVVGGVLVAAAGVLLITKKRMSGRD